MTDLTQYSEQELSLEVFNNEGLYSIRFSTYLMDTLREVFTFTQEQEEVLTQDLLDDLNE